MENADHPEEIKKPASPKSETVGEPELAWHKEVKPKKIVLSSLHDQEQNNYLFWLSITPEERIANVTSMIREIFAEELKQPRKSNRIIFDSV